VSEQVPEGPPQDAPEEPGQDPGGAGPEQQEDLPEAPGEDDQTFDAKYVRELRQEAAANRVRADRASTRLLELSLSTYGAALADPADLLVYEDQATILGEDGLVDADKVQERVADLLRRKPHLAKPVYTQDIGQGPRGRGEDGQRSFTDLLRAAAG
jgi:hypothetical protein